MKTLLFAAALSLTAAAALAQTEPSPGGPNGEDHSGGPRVACRADLQTYCSGVEPGGGRLMQCMNDHRDQLSEACKTSLAKARGGHWGHGSQHGQGDQGGAPPSSGPSAPQG